MSPQWTRRGATAVYIYLRAVLGEAIPCGAPG